MFLLQISPKTIIQNGINLENTETTEEHTQRQCVNQSLNSINVSVNVYVPSVCQSTSTFRQRLHLIPIYDCLSEGLIPH